MGIETAIIGAAGVSAVGSAIAGSKAAKAQSKAADQAAAAQSEATNLQRDIFETTREDYAPWRAAGEGALTQLVDLYGLGTGGLRSGASAGSSSAGASGADVSDAGMLAAIRKQYGVASPADLAAGVAAGDMVGGKKFMFDQFYDARGDRITNPALARSYFDALTAAEPSYKTFAQQQAPVDSRTTQQRQSDAMDKFFTSPGYNFRLQEGLKALERYSAARGKFASGDQLKAANDYAQGTASSEFANYQNALMSMAGLGQNATNATANAAANYGNAVQTGATNQGNIALQAGNARASGYMGLAQSLNQGLENVTGYYTLQSMLKGMQPAAG